MYIRTFSTWRNLSPYKTGIFWMINERISVVLVKFTYSFISQLLFPWRWIKIVPSQQRGKQTHLIFRWIQNMNSWRRAQMGKLHYLSLGRGDIKTKNVQKRISCISKSLLSVNVIPKQTTKIWRDCIVCIHIFLFFSFETFISSIYKIGLAIYERELSNQQLFSFYFVFDLALPHIWVRSYLWYIIIIIFMQLLYFNYSKMIMIATAYLAERTEENLIHFTNIPVLGKSDSLRLTPPSDWGKP